MKFNQLFSGIIFVSALFFEILPAKSFNLVEPNSSLYPYEVNYTTPVGNKGKVWIDPLQKLSPPTPKLLNLFRQQFSSYNFEASNTPVYGNISVDGYAACAPGFCPVPTSNVGAYLSLKYEPQKIFDPQLLREYNRFPDPLTGRVRWIQWVTDNHATSDRHGVKEATIDTTSNTPFYYYESFLPEIFNKRDPYYFEDNPGREDVGWNHDWLANLYLAYEKIDPITEVTTVQIFGGVRWGWHNRVERKKKEPTDVPNACPVKNSASNCEFYSFSDGLSSGFEVDKFQLSSLTPGKKFYAYIDNDMLGNQCNPNTLLKSYNQYNALMKTDNDSSPLGDGWGSALTNFVSSDGKINLSVSAANFGLRGEDRGSYELNIEVFDNDEVEPDISSTVGSSGGGGVVFERPRPGNTQNNPILPRSAADGWQVFNNVPSCRWYDPPASNGFEFEALDGTLFAEILDFPTGLDHHYTVSVGDQILGEFSPGDSLDFVSLLGAGVPNFKITDIDSLIGNTPETAFPIQLAFDDRIGSFKMRPIEPEAPRKVPEPTSWLGLIGLLATTCWQGMKIWRNK